MDESKLTTPKPPNLTPQQRECLSRLENMRAYAAHRAEGYDRRNDNRSKALDRVEAYDHAIDIAMESFTAEQTGGTRRQRRKAIETIVKRFEGRGRTREMDSAYAIAAGLIRNTIGK